VAFVIVELFGILLFFSQQKLFNTSGNHAAKWQQKLSADLTTFSLN